MKYIFMVLASPLRSLDLIYEVEPSQRTPREASSSIVSAFTNEWVDLANVNCVCVP